MQYGAVWLSCCGVHLSHMQPQWYIIILKICWFYFPISNISININDCLLIASVGSIIISSSSFLYFNCFIFHCIVDSTSYILETNTTSSQRISLLLSIKNSQKYIAMVVQINDLHTLHNNNITSSPMTKIKQMKIAQATPPIIALDIVLPIIYKQDVYNN